MDAKDLLIEKQAVEIKTLKETITWLKDEIRKGGLPGADITDSVGFMTVFLPVPPFAKATERQAGLRKQFVQKEKSSCNSNPDAIKSYIMNCIKLPGRAC
jgi:hypothetical protein